MTDASVGQGIFERAALAGKVFSSHRCSVTSCPVVAVVAVVAVVVVAVVEVHLRQKEPSQCLCAAREREQTTSITKRYPNSVKRMQHRLGMVWITPTRMAFRGSGTTSCPRIPPGGARERSADLRGGGQLCGLQLARCLRAGVHEHHQLQHLSAHLRVEAGCILEEGGHDGRHDDASSCLDKDKSRVDS